MTSLAEWISKQKEIEAKATTGAWEIVVEDTYEETVWCDREKEKPITIYDMNFIDNARNNYAKLLNALERAMWQRNNYLDVTFDDTADGIKRMWEVIDRNDKELMEILK